MKITEELWNENSYNVRRGERENDYKNSIDYYFTVARKITKKEILRTLVDEKLTTNEGYKMYTDLLLGKEFLSKNNLTPAFNYLVSSCTKDNSYATRTDLYGCYEFMHKINKEDSFQDLKTLPLMLFGDNIIICLSVVNRCDNDSSIYQTSICIRDIYYTSDKVGEVEEILKSLQEINKKLPDRPNTRAGQIKVGFAYFNEYGKIEIFSKFVKVKDIQLNQFNESLPHEKIVNILNKEESGLILLHGEPGCGKSSYIKYLIRECKDKYFVILSQDLLQNMNSFREFLLRETSPDTVIVIEDCENLVKSRERAGTNLIISDFLNITDGIYGDLYRLKFILTFNTDVQTIDQALLRKGRLKCKYKFSKLKGKRLKELSEKLGIKLLEKQIEDGVSLADLFNYDEDNGGKQKEIVKIGFNK